MLYLSRILFINLLFLLLLSPIESSLRGTLNMNKASSLCKSLVICGPSGVGKSTLVGRLLKEFPNKFGLSVSHTSRKPRSGELDGVHYHFISKDDILKDIKTGAHPYIEHAEVHANIYGTRSDSVDKVHQDGKICLIDIDRRGVMQVKKSGLSAKYLFIAPLSMEVLADRLKGRGTETEEQLALRLHNAKEEIDYGLATGNFDAIVTNDELDKAYNDLLGHARNWFPFLHI